MDSREQPPDAEPRYRRDWSWWLGLLLILLMLCTVLTCATLFWASARPHM
jgi:hypothetical protein